MAPQDEQRTWPTPMPHSIRLGTAPRARTRPAAPRRRPVPLSRAGACRAEGRGEHVRIIRVGRSTSGTCGAFCAATSTTTIGPAVTCRWTATPRIREPSRGPSWGALSSCRWSAGFISAAVRPGSLGGARSTQRLSGSLAEDPDRGPPLPAGDVSQWGALGDSRRVPPPRAPPARAAARGSGSTPSRRVQVVDPAGPVRRGRYCGQTRYAVEPGRGSGTGTLGGATKRKTRRWDAGQSRTTSGLPMPRAASM